MIKVRKATLTGEVKDSSNDILTVKWNNGVTEQVKVDEVIPHEDYAMIWDTIIEKAQNS